MRRDGRIALDLAGQAIQRLPEVLGLSELKLMCAVTSSPGEKLPSLLFRHHSGMDTEQPCIRFFPGTLRGETLG